MHLGFSSSPATSIAQNTSFFESIHLNKTWPILHATGVNLIARYGQHYSHLKFLLLMPSYSRLSRILTCIWDRRSRQAFEHISYKKRREYENTMSEYMASCESHHMYHGTRSNHSLLVFYSPSHRYF